METLQYKAAAFYKFVGIDKSELSAVRAVLFEQAEKFSIFGLIVLAEEGLNGTVAGLNADVDSFVEFLKQQTWADEIEVKYSPSHFQPFKRFKVDIRPEIVTSKNLSLTVDGKNNHLSAEQWHAWITSENPPLLVDTRNDYESRIGTFKGAITPQIKEFSQFADYLESSGLPKEQPMLIFCTGGIRCEKAILEANRLGYNNTYQLDGGILKYIEEYPQGAFDGECFVFDSRIAVDSKLLPTEKYKLCPHCGEPGEIKINCGRCNEEAICCETCSPKNACSKNCAYHLGVFKADCRPESFLKGLELKKAAEQQANE